MGYDAGVVEGDVRTVRLRRCEGEVKDVKEEGMTWRQGEGDGDGEEGKAMML